MSSESLLLSYWPNLKAVVDMRCVRSDFSFSDRNELNDVWITAENALAPVINGFERNNPVRRIANLLYGAGLPQSTLSMTNPIFATKYQVEGGTREEHGAFRYDSVPSASLVTNLLRIRFQIIASRSDPSSTPTALDKRDWIWRLCCFARAASPHLFSIQVYCRQSVDVLYWLSSVKSH